MSSIDIYKKWGWVDNIRHYGDVVVGILTSTSNQNAPRLWKVLTEPEFYAVVAGLANGWDRGLDLRGARYDQFYTGYAYYWGWTIPLKVENNRVVHGQQFWTGEILLTSPGDTPNMRPGFGQPMKSSHVIKICSNKGRIEWEFTPVVHWDQSYDMSMRLLQNFNCSYVISLLLEKNFSTTSIMDMRVSKDFDFAYPKIDMRLQGTREHTQALSAVVLRNNETQEEIDMLLVTWPELQYNMDISLLKSIDLHYHVSAVVLKHENVSQTMDMDLVKIPTRAWIIPQMWNLQTREEMHDNSTGPTFDSHRAADRKAAGGK